MSIDPTSGWVVDASIALKWFLPSEIEADSDIARSLIGKTGLRTTSLAYFEVGNRLSRPGGLKAKDVAACLEIMDQICGPQLELTQSDFGTCANIVKQYGITFYDASYVAISQRLNRTVLSADSHLLDPGLATSLSSAIGE